jgi:hypothetical protein
MRRLIFPAVGALVAVLTCAGCASVSRVATGSGGASDLPASVAPTGIASATASPPDTSVSGPAISVPPTGPAATAARDTPPPMGKPAAASVAGVTVSCPADAYVAGGSKGRTPLPADVTIKAVVRCETVLRAYPGIGEWSVQLAEVADSTAADLADLASQLRQPSEPTPPNIACAAYLGVTPWFAVIDDHGRVLAPSLPTDKCGQYLPSVGKALSALGYRAVDAVRLGQTRAPESIKTGCEQQWKDMVALEGARHPAGLNRSGLDGSSVADPASPSSSVLVCLYKAGSVDGDVGVGELVKGATVTGDAAATLASAAARTEPLPAGCEQAEQFAVISSSAYVEISGCHRVLTSDGRLGAASPELLAQVHKALGLS